MITLEEKLSELNKDAKTLLYKHLNLGIHKPASYLPIKTIENFLHLTIDEYQSLININGGASQVFKSEFSCIESGAVYGYSTNNLENLLVNNKTILELNNWPINVNEFISKIASDWLENNHPLIYIIRQCFGS